MDKDKREQLPYLVVIAVALVAIVAIVALVFYGNGSIEGAPIYKVQMDEYVRECIDDDPTNDWDVAGTVKYGTIDYLDHCRDNELYQYYCATSNIIRLTRSFECPNGCEYGVCISE